MKLFWTPKAAAAEIGINVRNFAKFARRHGVKPIPFRGASRHFYTRQSVEQLKKLRASCA